MKAKSRSEAVAKAVYQASMFTGKFLVLSFPAYAATAWCMWDLRVWAWPILARIITVIGMVVTYFFFYYEPKKSKEQQ